MKIYVVSNAVCGVSDFFVKQLAQVEVQPSKAFPVIVVDERSNLNQLSSIDDVPLVCTSFRLEDFLDYKVGGGGSEMWADVNRIANKISVLSTEWVWFDFGQNNLEGCVDFVRKLARCNYMTRILCNKSIVFSVPNMHCQYIARILNESFNILPCDRTESDQLGMLFLSIRIERLVIRFLVFARPLIVVRRVLSFMYRRFKRRGA